LRHSADANGVTTLADAPAFEGTVPDAPPPGRFRTLAVAQAVALVLPLVVWGRFVTAGAGGRDDGRLLLGLVALLPAICLIGPVRPRRGEALLSLWIGAAAFTVCALSAFAFAGAEHAAALLYGILAFAVARAALTTPLRRTLFVVMLALVCLDQFAQAFLAWWGGQDPSHEMIGTFYWRNQFAAFLLPGVAAGSALAVFGQRPWRAVGWITGPLCVAGIVFSTSRASMAAAFGIVLVVAVAAAVGPDRRARVPAALALVALSFVATFGFSSSAFFPHSGSPFAGTAHRAAAGEGLATNTSYRLDFMRSGVSAAADRPVLGAGFGSFADVSAPHLAAGSTRSTSAHNELVQAWAEGGALFGLPVTALFLLLLAGSARAVWRGLVGREAAQRVLHLTAGLATGALLMHALVDVDWSFPSLIVELALLTALLCSLRPAGGTPQPDRGWSRPVVAGVMLLAAGLAVGCAQVADRTSAALSESLLHRQDVVAAAAPLLDARSSYAPDPRLDARLLALSAGLGPDQALLPADVVRPALERTARYGAVDPEVQTARIRTMFALGERNRALATARELAQAHGQRRPVSVQPYAELLLRTGRTRDAAMLLAGTVRERATPASAALAAQLAPLITTLQQGGPELASATRCAMSAYDGAYGRSERPTALRDIEVATAADHCEALLNPREVLR
jgi:hypothetical protein